MEWIVTTLIAIAVVTMILSIPYWAGLTIIGPDQVGVIIKKFGGKRLPSGQYIALNGEAGVQADTLTPGCHLGFFPWQYTVKKNPITAVPSGKLLLLSAKGGSERPNDRILGKRILCNNFQDARAFLSNGGEKGPQSSVLTAGVYRLNTELFQILGVADVTTINPDQVGVVTTLDGTSISEGEIAGRVIDGHNSFQDVQAFIEKGGQKGLQEQVLMAGSWNLNPMFVKVEFVGITEVPIGSVGVVISYVGKEHKDISGDDFKHGDLVDQGHKGVWAVPLYPGKHPLNVRTTKVEIVPTTNIALNWMDGYAEAHKLDTGLESISIRSKDGFPWKLEVTTVIHVGATDASKVISRFGTMKNVVDQVLEPAIGNYFRNSAQNFTVLDFLSGREARQKDALQYIRAALNEYNIETVDAYIGDMSPPAELIKTQTDKKLAEEQRLTFVAQEATQKQAQSLQKETALANIQAQLVSNEQQVKMNEFQAQSAIKKAEGEAKSVELAAVAQATATKARAGAEAEAVRVKGDAEASATRAVGLAKAEAYKAGAEAMGDDYGKLQIMQVIGDKGVKLIPDTLITGGSDGGSMPGLLTSALMANMLGEKIRKRTAEASTVS